MVKNPASSAILLMFLIVVIHNVFEVKYLPWLFILINIGMCVFIHKKLIKFFMWKVAAD